MMTDKSAKSHAAANSSSYVSALGNIFDLVAIDASGKNQQAQNPFHAKDCKPVDAIARQARLAPCK
jgi:hypothetical protein